MEGVLTLLQGDQDQHCHAKPQTLPSPSPHHHLQKERFMSPAGFRTDGCTHTHMHANTHTHTCARTLSAH